MTVTLQLCKIMSLQHRISAQSQLLIRHETEVCMKYTQISHFLLPTSNVSRPDTRPFLFSQRIKKKKQRRKENDTEKSLDYLPVSTPRHLTLPTPHSLHMQHLTKPSHSLPSHYANIHIMVVDRDQVISPQIIK
jgi:hypothetical protein